jgi:hypothetical protein
MQKEKDNLFHCNLKPLSKVNLDEHRVESWLGDSIPVWRQLKRFAANCMHFNYFVTIPPEKIHPTLFCVIQSVIIIGRIVRIQLNHKSILSFAEEKRTEKK